MRPLVVCYSTESVSWTGTCTTDFTFPWEGSSIVRTSNSECVDGSQFCGYEWHLWTTIAAHLDLREGHDWVRLCIGGSGFYQMVADLSEYTANMTYRPATCDFSASGMIATAERSISKGLQFTRAISRSSVGVLVRSDIVLRGRWEFLKPLTVQVWIAMFVTIAAAPIAVVAFEMLMHARSWYRAVAQHRERGNVWAVLWRAYGEGVWQSAGQLLQMRMLNVRSTPSRIMCAAFAFTTCVFSNTYLANLSAWITKDQITSTDVSVRDMWQKTVGTYPVYQAFLKSSYDVSAFAIPAVGERWGQNLANSIRNGSIDGAVIDEVTIQSIIQKDRSCEMRMLPDLISLSDTVFAFRRNYANVTLMRSVDRVLLKLLEIGYLQALRDRMSAPFKVSHCEFVVDDDPARAVPLKPLSGLWILYGACVVAAVAISAMKLAYIRLNPKTAAAHDVGLHMRMLMNAARRVVRAPDRSPDLVAAGSETVGARSESVDLAKRRLRQKVALSQMLLADLLHTVHDIQWHAKEAHRATRSPE